MEDKELNIRIELDEHNVVNNPFEAMLYQSLELTRDLLFACHRMQSEELSEDLCINLDGMLARMNIIKDEFEKLEDMSKETIEIYQKNCEYYDQNHFNIMNTTLLELEKRLQTTYNKVEPCRELEFEQYRLGKDSKEFKRLQYLRSLIDNYDGEHKLADDETQKKLDYLHRLSDVFDWGRECIDFGWMSEEEYNERVNILKKYKFTVYEIDYMASYIEKTAMNK